MSTPSTCRADLHCHVTAGTVSWPGGGGPQERRLRDRPGAHAACHAWLRGDDLARVLAGDRGAAGGRRGA